MIIVSQDKKKIINFDNVLNIHTQIDEKKSLFFAETERYAIFLGEYKTEERAKEVLRDIVKAIIENRKANDTKDLFGFSIMPSDTYYEMPEE